jgi:RimJ/RimL family protein N-acetyltransferase
MMNFDFTNDYILENDIALLRPLNEKDKEHLFYFSLNEPEIWKYSLVQANGEENLNSYIKLALEAREQKKEYPFIVYDKRTGEYAGSSRFYDIQTQNKSLQLGYTWYGKKFQGTGLNKHCKYLLLSFAFEKMGVERVEFRADIRNEKSIAAMKSIGCVVEGVLRKNCITARGECRDSIILSILSEEWFGNVKEFLELKLV